MIDDSEEAKVATKGYWSREETGLDHVLAAKNHADQEGLGAEQRK